MPRPKSPKSPRDGIEPVDIGSLSLHSSRLLNKKHHDFVVGLNTSLFVRHGSCLIQTPPPSGPALASDSDDDDSPWPARSSSSGNSDAPVNSVGLSYFPLHVEVHTPDPARILLAVSGCDGAHLVTWSDENSVVLDFVDKGSADSLVPLLLNESPSVKLNYSNFISHPGNLFVKNLAGCKTSHQALRSHFNGQSKYRSLASIDLFGPNGSEVSPTMPDVFAVLKFDNHLDVDHLIANLDLTNNPFHLSEHLYINRYISKKERKLDVPHAPSSPAENTHVYDTVVIEDWDLFFGPSSSIDRVAQFVEKLQLFHPVESSYFPVDSIDEEGVVDLAPFAYISFAPGPLNERLNHNVLRALFYLNGLTLDELINFDASMMYDILRDINKEVKHPVDDVPRLKMSIAQHKHNHHLLQPHQGTHFLFTTPSPGSPPTVSVGLSNIHLHQSILHKFSKSLNYQETNVYVNNLSLLFENNDELWARFWNQFGYNGIKSAKIIKPNFYNRRHDETLGKIGFVFYSCPKLALRAILLTNNKTITYENHTVSVQASFAIQKNSGPAAHAHSQLMPVVHYTYPSRPSLAHNFYGKRFSAPEYLPVSPPSSDHAVPPPMNHLHSSPPFGAYGLSPSSIPMIAPVDYYNYYNPFMYYRMSSPDDDLVPVALPPLLNPYFLPYFPVPVGPYTPEADGAGEHSENEEPSEREHLTN